MEEWVEIGKIYTTFGLNGEVKIYAYTEEKVFCSFDGKDVWIESGSSLPIKVKMNKVRPSKKRSFLVKLEGFDSLNQSKRVVGRTVSVEKSSLPPSKEGEYYFYEIIGMKVFDENDTYVGEVSDVIQTGANDVFVVKNEESEILVPAVKDYILKLDKANSKLKIRRLVWY